MGWNNNRFRKVELRRALAAARPDDEVVVDPERGTITIRPARQSESEEVPPAPHAA